MTAQPSRFLIYAAIMGQQFIGALAFPITKAGLTGVPPYTFAFFRFLIASSLLMALLPILGDPVPVTRRDGFKIAALGGVIVVFNQTLFIVGQNFTTSTHGALLFAFTPVFIYGLSIFLLGEKFTWLRGFGVLLAVSGAVVIVSQRGLDFDSDMLKGDLIILVAVLAWAVYSVYGKPLVQKYGAFKVTAYAAVSGTLVYFPFGLYHTLNTDLGAIPATGWWAIVYMGSFLSVGAYTFWYWAIKHTDASRVAPFHNFQPLIAAVAAYYMLGEIIDDRFILGGGLTLAGVLIVELSALHHDRKVRRAQLSDGARSPDAIRKTSM